MELQTIVNHADATIVDVRTREEFEEGHVPGSRNIPMDEVTLRIDEFRSMSKPIILCCASGNRSGGVTRFLTSQGFNDVFNGGGWTDVVSMLKN